MDFSKRLTPHQHLVIHLVDPALHGSRLDLFLSERYKRRSRAQIQDAIDNGSVQIRRPSQNPLSVGRIKASVHLMSGDEVLVLTERKPEPQVDFNYQILFEDKDLFAISKPGNLPVHPAGRFFFNTLLTHLQTAGFTQPLRSNLEYYLVHRIDRETSGVLLLAKTHTACAHLVNQFAKRLTRKRYLALVHGWPQADSFEQDQSMGRSNKSSVRLKMEILPESEGGQSALTQFKVLNRFEKSGKKFSLIDCAPKTGRQHQIRVHLANAGFPIVGDKLYSLSDSQALSLFEREPASRFIKPLPRQTASDRAYTLPDRFIPAEIEDKLIMKRHALHASELEFTHPLTGKKTKFEAPIPQDFLDFMQSRPNSG